MRKFKEFDIWKNGVSLVTSIYPLTKNFPSNEKYGLASQIQRAVVSIPSNIAEGCSRESEKEFARFLQIAVGSAFELESHLLIAQEIGLIKQENLSTIMDDLITEQKMISSLIKKLKANSS